MLSQSSMPSPPLMPSPLIEPAASNITAIFDARTDQNLTADGSAVLLRGAGAGGPVRVICLTSLDRKGGSAEFLQGLADWTAKRPELVVELLWAGEGVMRAVLAAQPNPPNLVQHFVGRLELQAIVALLVRCQVLVVPRVSELSKAVATYALLSGVHVLCGETRRKKWGVLQQRTNLHCYSRHHCETLLPVLSGALATPAAAELACLKAASYAA